MKTFFNLREQQESSPEKTAVFAFGRFQPPTAGHAVVFDKVKEVAKAKNADHRIYFSRTDPSVLGKKTKESFK